MFSFFLRFIALIVSCSCLILFAPGKGNTEPFDVRDPEACELVLTVFSDEHVEGNNYPRYKVFADCLRNSLRNESGSDAFLFLGDNTMNGQNIENLMFHGTVDRILGDRKIITIPGNHDFGNGEGDFDKIQNRWYRYTNAFFGRHLTTPYFYDVVDGFYFIVLANEQQNIDTMHISDAQFEWLEATLAEAAESGLPVFVLAHYTPRMADPINDDSPYDLCRMLADFNREHDLFYLCGHLHHDPDLSSFHAWSGFPETYLPCLTHLQPGNVIDELSGFGEIIEVYSDRVTMRMRNFYYGEWAEYNGAPLEATFMLKNPIVR